MRSPPRPVHGPIGSQHSSCRSLTDIWRPQSRRPADSRCESRASQFRAGFSSARLLRALHLTQRRGLLWLSGWSASVDVVRQTNVTVSLRVRSVRALGHHPHDARVEDREPGELEGHAAPAAKGGCCGQWSSAQVGCGLVADGGTGDRDAGVCGRHVTHSGISCQPGWPLAL